MHIGVDATAWQNTRGYGRHARALLRTLLRLDANNAYTLFVDSADFVEAVPPEADIRLVRAATPTAIAASAQGRRRVLDMWYMSRALSGPDLDLLLFPTVYSYVPVFSQARKIVFMHDVIAETYPQLTLPSLTARLLWKAKVALGRWQADAIVTVSDYSRTKITERLNFSPERIFVVGEASDPLFREIGNPVPTAALAALPIPADALTLVYVGGFGPHKNLETLVSVFGKLVAQEEFSNLRLVMVGEYESEVFYSYFGTIKQQIEGLGIEEYVVFTGFLPDQDLVVLLNLATVLVLPSLMEGFGLPAVEAAACGCPVIATMESPLPTLLGDAGLYIDPLRPEELESALVRVLKSPGLRQQMREAGLEAASRLTWEAAAHQMMSIMQEVIAQ